MKLTFVSNYINHHQIPLAEELYKKQKDGYHFIQTEPMEEERVRMGWNKDTRELPYLLTFQEHPEQCRELILESDVAVFGGTDDESYIEPRLEAGKITIRNSERIYKEGQWKAVSPRGLRKKYHDHTRHRNAPVYLLCAGGYVPCDFQIVKAYPNKMFKWGYFPGTREYQITKLVSEKRKYRKEPDAVSLLWAGRMIDWKHPEFAVQAARDLQEDGFCFHLTMIGGGEMEEELKAQAAEYGLQDVVTFLGFQKPEQVREKMEESEIFLFTSDYKEGWGAVLNEAMNAGCAVVAGHGIGAVPYLLQHQENGLIFKNKDYKDFYKQVKKILFQEDMRKRIGVNAYDTIVSVWNEKNAAASLLEFCRGLRSGNLLVQEEGPLSTAEVIAENQMYKHLMEEGR